MNSATLMSGYIIEESSKGTPFAGEALLLRMMPFTSVIDKSQIWGGSINFKDIRNPMLNVAIVSSRNGAIGVYRNETPIAQECVLHWCVKRMRTSLYFGSLQEEVISVAINSTRGSNPWKTENSTTPGLEGTVITYLENLEINVNTSTGTENFGMSDVHQGRILANFDDVFPSFLTVANTTASSNWRYKTFVEGEPYFRIAKQNPWVYPSNITAYMERMATSLTNIARSSSTHELVEGQAHTIETYVNVQWAWLTFPFILLLFSLIFLVATMRKTAQGPGIWKNSAMPTLIYSLPKDVQKEFSPPSTHKKETSSSEGSKSIRVRLHPTKGWRVSGQPASPVSPVMILRSNEPPPGWI